jgi:hypothetical protein
MKAHLSIRQFKKKYTNMIRAYQFTPGDLEIHA